MEINKEIRGYPISKGVNFKKEPIVKRTSGKLALEKEQYQKRGNISKRDNIKKDIVGK